MMESTEQERTKRLVAMGEMAASLAHEIRNPLGSMELFCSLLKKDLETQPDLLYLAEQIHKGIRTLDRVITNSLQFVRDSEPNLKKVEDLDGFLREIIEAATHRAAASDATLSLSHTGTGAVIIDRFQLHQALLNIVLNACDAVDGRDEREIQLLSTLDENGEWQILVRDTGIGIAEEDLLRVFDPFFTKKEKGTGLGLSIVLSIVTAHGGTCDVRSRVGMGSEFEITIPGKGVSA